LAEDLRLADDHRVQAGGDPKHVPDSIATAQREEIRLHRTSLDPAELREPAYEEIAGALGIFVTTRNDLDAVAGRKQDHFAHARWVQEPSYRGVHGAIANAQLLTNSDRRRVMIQAYDDDVECHGGTNSQEPSVWP
jgi:hypothetical protein